MPASSRTFWLPRRGHAPAEYEDAFAADAAAGRFAVADGATEGCFTGLWAKLLVDGFVANVESEMGSWPASLAPLQARWDADVSARGLPWYAESSVRQGEFAAFLGLVLSIAHGDCPDFRGDDGVVPEEEPRRREGTGRRLVGTVPFRPGYQWQAVAVGDSCLLHSRQGMLLHAFPLERTEQFDNLPRLVGSRMAAGEIAASQSLWADGCGRAGDRLWMMTDALAQCCLAEVEAGRNPLGGLEPLLIPPAGGAGVPPVISGGGTGVPPVISFASWIEGLRDAGKLRNDDVTLLAIDL